MANNTLRVAVSLLLMVALLAFFLWNVDFKEMATGLRQANLWLVALAAVLALISYWARVIRWILILRPVARVRHSSAVLATAVGYTAITLLPARMGDILRPVILAKRDRFPVSAGLASILTERVFDLWTVVLFFLVFLIWPPFMPNLDADADANLHLLRITGYAVGAILTAGTVVLLGLFRYQDRFVAILSRPLVRLAPSWRDPFANFLNHFLDGLRVLQRPRDLLITMTASFALWFIIYWQVKVTLMAFGLDLPLRVSFLLVTLAVMGLAIPTPGGVGGFHKATQVGLTTFFGVELNLATAIAIVYHAICFVPITIIGLACLPLLGMRFSEMRDMAEEGDSQ
ncbi:MAG: lysylphosphatidylglycerol synthase transmembrane domain-containing protein [Thermoanaerobaculales bacterium]|nr:lysylphosphatidylglycerol synthase transmembrane domain-containing protein [Thermoanaerobaculales bacterium]